MRTAAMDGRSLAAGAKHACTNATTDGGTPRSVSATTGGRPPPTTCFRSASSFCVGLAVGGSVAIISASYGVNPLNTCHVITPKLYTSLADVMPAAGSYKRGSMYTTVPRAPASVPRVLASASRSTLLPKSASLAEGRRAGAGGVSSTLSGFTSAWMTDCECRYSSPIAASTSSCRRSTASAP